MNNTKNGKTVCPLEWMVTDPPPTIPTTYPFWLQSIPNLTKPLLILVGILITSPAAFLNLPNNSFCPLDTALVSTSDNFHLMFPPSPLPFLSCNPPGGNFHVVPSFVHINWLSSDQERHLWSSKYLNYVSVCLCVLFVWSSLHISIILI